MELQQLRYFKCVAETGRINAAAKALYISPPALSASIARLEKDLGCTLFDRSNNSITLNRNGEILRKYVDQVFHALDAAEAELAQAAEADRTHICIAVTTSNLWIGLICAFSLEYPQITLSYTTLKLSQLGASLSPKYHFLMAEENDFDGSALCSEVLFDDDRPVLMVHPEHPLANEASIDLSAHPDENFILPTADLSLHKMAAELLAAAGIQKKNLYEYTYMVRRSAVMARQGVSFSTLYTSRNEDPNLRYIPIDRPYCRWTQRIYWDKAHVLSPEEELFRQFAVEYFRNK